MQFGTLSDSAKTAGQSIASTARPVLAVTFSILLVVSILSGAVMLPGADSDHSGTAAAQELDSSDEEWTYNMGSSGYDAAQMEYSGTNNALHAVGRDYQTAYSIAPDGTENWQHSTSSNALAVGVDEDTGEVWVGTSGSTVRRLNPDGTEQANYSVASEDGIAFDEYSDTAYVRGDASIYSINASTGNTKTLYSDSEYTDAVGDVVSDAEDGFVFSAMGPAGFKAVDLGTESLAWENTELQNPDVVAVDKESNRVYSGSENGEIRAYQYDGSVEWTVTPSSGAEIADLTYDATQHLLYFIDTNGDIYQVSPDDGSSTYLHNAGSSGGSIAVDGESGTAFYSISNSDQITALDIPSAGAVSGEVTGRVTDQAGNPVENATVYSIGFNTSDPPQLGTRNLEEVLENPLPTEWQDQIENMAGFSSSPTVDADEFEDQFDDTRVLMHTSENWGLDTVPLTAGTVETVPSDVEARAVTKPGEEQLFTCWDFDLYEQGGLDYDFGDGIDNSILGGVTTPCSNITIERVDPLGDSQYSETVEPKPLVSSRAAANVGWSDDTGWAVKHHYGYRTDLDQGVYRVYPEGKQEQSMVYVVAPNNNADALEAEIENYVGDQIDRRTKFNDEMEQLYSENSIDIQSTTTNKTGYYGLNVDTNKVTRMELRAVKGGTELNVDRKNLSQDHLRSEFETSVKQSFSAETTADWDTSDQQTFRNVCERMDSVIDDVGSPYVGSTSTDVPNDNANIEGYRLIPPDANERVRKCAEMNIAEQFLDDPLSLLPGFAGDLSDYTKAELESLYGDLMGLVGANDELRSELENRVDGELPEDGSELSEGELETVIRDGFEVIESPPSGGGFNDGGGSSLPGSGSDTPSIDDPEEVNDRINETISRSWPVTGVGSIEDAGVLLRIVFSDGSEEVLGPDSEYVTLEDNAVGADKVHLEEYPFNSSDSAVARISLDVATQDGHDRNRGRARNPTFDGDIPGLDSLRLSSSSPGKTDTITVGATPSDQSRWGGVQHVNVTGPDCSKSIQATDDAAQVEMCGAGTHRLAVTYANADGTQFTEVVQVNARAASQARPPAIRAGSGPVGRYAIVANGLADGRLDVSDGASQVTLTGIVAADADVPNRVTASTTGVDVARDATTAVRLKQGDTEQTIRERVSVLLHVDQLDEESLLYRNGRPIRNPGETADAIVETRNASTIIDTYTGETAEVRVEVSRNPGLIERFTHNVRLRFPSLPIGFAFVPLPAGGLLGGMVLVARRRRNTEEIDQ